MTKLRLWKYDAVIEIFLKLDVNVIIARINANSEGIKVITSNANE